MTRRCSHWVCLWAALLVWPLPWRASGKDVASAVPIPKDRILEIATGKTETILLKTAADRINIGKKGVITLFMPTERALSISGKSVGYTSLSIQYSDGTLEEYGIRVTGAPAPVIEKLTTEIRGYLAQIPGIQVEPAGDRILITGKVSKDYESSYRKVIGMFQDLILDQVQFGAKEEAYEQLKKYLADIPGIRLLQIEDKVIISGDVDPKHKEYYAKIVALFPDRVIDQVHFSELDEIQKQLQVVRRQLNGYLAEIPSIQIKIIEDKIVLDGTVDAEREEYYRQVVAPFKQLIIDLVKVPEYKSSVQVDAQVIEISQDATHDLGIEWFASGPWQITATGSGQAATSGATSSGSGSSGSSSSSGSGSSGASPGGATANSSGGNSSQSSPNPGLTASGQINLQQVTFNLIALAKEGKARLLASPKLSVQSGQKASFQVGGELPISQTTAFSSNVEWKKFGTILDISPAVQNSEEVAIGITATVSQFDFSRLVQGNPTLLSKVASTSLRVKSGQTFAIAGLFSNEEAAGVSKVPLLGDIPGIGYLFKRRTAHQTKTETIVLFTPLILKPDAPSDPKVRTLILPSPALERTRRELLNK